MRSDKWPMKEQSRYLIQLGDLLENGFSLHDAIEFTLVHCHKSRRARVVTGLDLLKQGDSVRDFLQHLGFLPQLVGIVMYGEETGNLAQALKEGGTIWLKRGEDFQKLKKLLYYPLFLIGFVTILFQVFSSYLLPRFQDLYSHTENETNLYFFIVQRVSSLFSRLPIILIGTVCFLYIINHVYFRKLPPFIRERWWKKLPIIGQFRILSNTHYFVIQLGVLLKGGLSISDSLSIMKNADPNALIKDTAHEIIVKLQDGWSFDYAMKDIEFLDTDLPKIITHGQKNGKLGDELFYYSKIILTMIEEKTTIVLKFIQPLIFGCIALMVILLYLAILMPMLSAVNSI